jgi:hypothetical protein
MLVVYVLGKPRCLFPKKHDVMMDYGSQSGVQKLPMPQEISIVQHRPWSVYIGFTKGGNRQPHTRVVLLCIAGSASELASHYKAYKVLQKMPSEFTEFIDLICLSGSYRNLWLQAMKLTQYADWAHPIILGKKTKVNHSDENKTL